MQSKKNKLGIVLYSLFKRQAEQKSEPKVLVIFGGAIGDSIMFADALKAIILLYKERSKDLTLICTTTVERFLKETRRDISVNMISYDATMLITDYSYFRAFTESINTCCYEIIITPLHSKRADLIARNVCAQKKLAVRTKLTSKQSFAYWLDRMTYTEYIYTEPDNLLFRSYELLLKQLGHTDYKTKITLFKEPDATCDFEKYKPYCVLCPTAGEKEKCWEIDKFYKVTDYILDNSDLTIFVCAGSEGIGMFEHIKLSVKQPSRLCNCINQTTFSEWIELIRNAEFCFGNDSASTHIAAFTGTKYIAITSGFNYGAALPYEDDVTPSIYALPVVINHPMPCFGCFTINAKRCAGNRKCKANVRKNGRYLCVELIQVDKVIKAVDDILRI